MPLSPPSVFQDARFTITDDADPTKKAQFQVSGIATATTRTFTLPDASSTLMDLASAQTVTGTKTFQAIIINTALSAASLGVPGTSQLTGAVTVGDGTTSPSLSMDSTSGGSSSIAWRAVAAIKWYDQFLPSTGVRRYYDNVNAKEHFVCTAGAGAGGGLSEFNSAVKIVGNFGAFGGTPAAKQTVTGAKGANAALASLLAALAAYGLVTDSSTA